VVGIVVPPPKQRGSSKRRPAPGETQPTDDPLFDALRAWRRETAAALKVPPYVIFHDATLREIARQRPTTLDDLATVQGVGARKLEAHGEALLARLAAHPA